MWKTGGRTNPSITYTELKPGSKSGEHTWKDVVDYVVVSGSGKAKPKSIVGTDVIAAKESGSGRFVWRGSGWLGWVTCESVLGTGEPSETAPKHRVST